MRFLNQVRFCSSTIAHPSLKIQSYVPTSSNFVPKHEKASKEDIDKLKEFLHHHAGEEGLLVMTGAGISTESGLPDYRSEGVGLYARSTRRPLQVLPSIY